MCFSATASFSASIVIGAIAVVTILKAHKPVNYLFACIPLIFTFQQIAEGFVWLSFMNPAYKTFQNSLTCLFILFAQVIWPLWGPFSIFLLEKNVWRRNVLFVLAGFGILIAVYRIFWLCFYSVHALVSAHHIIYIFDSEASFSPIVPIIYFIITVFPPFISSVKKMWAVGFAVLSSFVFTKIFYGEYLVSVWCFSAALISGIVFLIMFDLKKTFVETV